MNCGVDGGINGEVDGKVDGEVDGEVNNKVNSEIDSEVDSQVNGGLDSEVDIAEVMNKSLIAWELSRVVDASQDTIEDGNSHNTITIPSESIPHLILP